MVTKVLKDVLERIESWPEDRQLDAARLLTEMEDKDAESYSLTDEQVDEVRRRRERPNRIFLTLDEARERFERRNP